MIRSIEKLKVRIDQNLNRAEKSEALREDVVKVESKVTSLKQVLQVQLEKTALSCFLLAISVSFFYCHTFLTFVASKNLDFFFIKKLSDVVPFLNDVIMSKKKASRYCLEISYQGIKYIRG